MSDKIEVGDMVMVVRPQPCCGSDRRIGAVYEVAIITNKHQDIIHDCCGIESTHVCAIGHNGRGELIEVLKKIPPLTEDTGEYIRKRAKA